MRSLSFIFPFFLAISTTAAAFKPFYSSKVSSLNRRSPGVITVRSRVSESRPRTISNGTRLHQNLPRWFPPSVSNRPGPRKLPNSTIKRSPSPADNVDIRPTPEPTGDPSPAKTVHVTDPNSFSLIMPHTAGGLISDAEADGVSYCSPGSTSSDSCSNTLPAGFITAAAVKRSDDSAYIQVTGCINPSKFSNINPSDAGGQFDVRYPNGAQCTFGGYGASFIEQIEPSANRFCLRCCASANDQVNCNSHKDRQGCPATIPGVYDFPALGINCT